MKMNATKPLGVALLALFVTALAHADDEKIPWITYEGKTYRNPRLGYIIHDSANFSSDDGDVTIPLKSLPIDVLHILGPQIDRAHEAEAQTEANAKAQEQEQASNIERLGGKVMQVILSGDTPVGLLIRDFSRNVDFLLTGYPHLDELADGDDIKYTLGKRNGVFHLPATDGTVRTLRRYQFVKFGQE